MMDAIQNAVLFRIQAFVHGGIGILPWSDIGRGVKVESWPTPTGSGLRETTVGVKKRNYSVW